MPMWKAFLIGVAALFVILTGLSLAANIANEHLEFKTRCMIEFNGQVTKIDGMTFCIDVQMVPEVVWVGGYGDKETYRITNECNVAGGKILNLSSASHDRGCYTYTIYKELGARHEYRANR